MIPAHILVAGCSFSADNEQSGWADNNLDKHYYSKLKTKIESKFTNIAIGGASNFEIFQRTLDTCISNSDIDFCVIQWSSLHRLWVYESENNIDDFTQILPIPCGINSNENVPHDLKKIYINHYCNDYMALKHWLGLQISLQSFFQERNIQYVFLRGFSNYINELENIISQAPACEIPDITLSATMKKMLNFDNNPDDYLNSKIFPLINLYKSIDKKNCLGYNHNNSYFGLDLDFEKEKDFADDGRHPGEKTNSTIANNILQYIRNKG